MRLIVEFVETLLLMPKLAVIENTWKSDTLVCSNEYFIILRFLLVSMLKVSESHTVLFDDSSSVMDFFPQIFDWISTDTFSFWRRQCSTTCIARATRDIVG